MTRQRLQSAQVRSALRNERMKGIILAETIDWHMDMIQRLAES
jgi:hypothetical protein